MALLRRNGLPMPAMKRVERRYDDLTDGRRTAPGNGVLPFKESRSFLLKEGGLFPFLGIEKPFGTLFSGVTGLKKIFFMRHGGEWFLAVGNHMHLIEAKQDGQSYLVDGQTHPEAVAIQANSGDVFDILISSTRGSYVCNIKGKLYSPTSLPQGNVLLSHFGRFYLLDGKNSRLYVSKAGTAREWDSSNGNGGYIIFPRSEGEISDMVCLNDGICLFRGDKVSILNVAGSLLDYEVKNISADVGNEIRGTAQALSGKVVFAKKEGIFSFDGKKAERIPVRSDVERELAMATDFESATYDGYYVLAYTYGTKRRTFFLDCKTGATCFWENGVSSLTVAGENTYFLIGGEVGRFVRSNAGGTWTSVADDFGQPGKRKCVRRVERTGSGTVTLSLYADGRKALIGTVVGDGGLDCNVCGEWFFVEIRSTDSGTVTGLKLRADVLGG